MTSLRWGLQTAATIGAAWLCAGCGAYTVTSTSGTIYRQSAALPDPMWTALRASASRDLPCDSDHLDVTRLEPQRAYAVTGCGRRVLYRALTPSLTSRHLELVSHSSVPPAGDVAALTQTKSGDRAAP